MVILLLVMTLVQADDTAATEAIAKFEAAFSKTKDNGTRASEISTLSAVQHEKVVSKLAPFLSHEDKVIRTSTAASLGNFTSAPPEAKKAASKALLGALSAGANQKEVDVKVAILTAVGNLQEESAGTALRSHFEDKDAKIAGAAITAAGAIKSKAMVEPLIEMLKECERAAKPPPVAPAGGKKMPVGRNTGGGASSNPANDPEAQKRDRANALLPVTQAALNTLTQANNAGGEEWEKWWSKNRGSFTVSK